MVALVRRRQHGSLHHPLSQRPDRRARRRADPADRRRLSRLRLLAERKQTILRSIESQGKLTPELAAAIDAADSTKQLEDLYLPFKPKKQSLATLARQRELEPLAYEILAADPAAARSRRPGRRFRQSRPQVLTAGRCAVGRRPYSGGGFQRTGRAAPAAAQDRQPHRQAGLREDRRSPKSREKNFATISNSGATRPRAAASHSGDQPRRKGQDAARARSRPTARPCSKRPTNCSCRPSIRTPSFCAAACATRWRGWCCPASNAKSAAS